jgi:uncharacterized protein (DUF433 family)
MSTVTSSISSHPEVLGGALVFQGTRVPAQTLLDYLQDGFSLDEFLENFPSVRRNDAIEFLKLVGRGEP